MPSLKGSQTEQNLLKAFAGESQARNRYNWFAKVARKEGHPLIEAIFMETAINEQAHAKRFFRFLEGGVVEITAAYPAGVIGTTEDNLAAAAAGENEEWTDLYPEFSRIAKEEGHHGVAAAFKIIARVEKEHEERYLALLERLKAGTLYSREAKVRWKCSKCGYIHEGNEPPGKCPGCLHPREFFAVDDASWR